MDGSMLPGGSLCFLLSFWSSELGARELGKYFRYGLEGLRWDMNQITLFQVQFGNVRHKLHTCTRAYLELPLPKVPLHVWLDTQSKAEPFIRERGLLMKRSRRWDTLDWPSAGP